MKKRTAGMLAVLMLLTAVYLISNYFPTIASLIRAPERAIKSVKRNSMPLATTIDKNKMHVSLPLKNPSIKIYKSKRVLRLYEGDKAIKSYPISLGFKPEGDKQKAGDGKTPEGEFYISQKAKNPDKKYLGTRWMRLSYPDKEHAAKGLESKLISKTTYDGIVKQLANLDTPLQNTKLGGGVGIHGGSDYIIGGTAVDWTAGCIGLYNADAEEIYAQVRVGIKIYIYE